MIKYVEQDKDEKFDFPRLMKNLDGTLVVLFSKENTGMVVKNNIHTDIGFYSNTWHMKDFKDYDGSLTLQNK